MCWLTDPQYSSGNSLISQTGNSLSNAVSDLGKGVENIGKGLENTLTAIANNPLPTLEAVALTYVLEDPQFLALDSATAGAIATTATQYANGNHDINSLLLNIGASLGGSMIGKYAGSVAASVSTEAELSASTTALIKNVVTSASGQAAAVAIKGGNLQQVLTAGVSGAVSATISTQLKSAGLQNAPAQVIANATAAATKAILGGKDIATAIGSSVAATAIQQIISSGVNSITGRQNNLSNLNNQYTQTATDFNNWISSNLKPVEDVLNTGATIQSNAQAIEAKINQFDAGAAIINGQGTPTADQLAAAGVEQTGTVRKIVGPIQEREWIFVPQYTLPDGTLMTGYNATTLTNYLNTQVQPLTDQSTSITQQISDYNAAYAKYQDLMPTYTNYQNQLSTIQTNINNESSALNTDIQNVSTAVVNYEQQITSDAADITKQIASEAASVVPGALDSAAQTQGFTDYAQMQKAQAEGFDPTDGATYQAATKLGYTDATTYEAAQQAVPGISASQYSSVVAYASTAGFGSNLNEALDAQAKQYTNIADYQLGQQLKLDNNTELDALKVYSNNAGFGTDYGTAQAAEKNGFDTATNYNLAKSLDLTTADQLNNVKSYATQAGFGTDYATAQAAQVKGFDTAQNYDTAVGLGIGTFSQLQNLKEFASGAGFGDSLATAQTAQNNGFTDAKDYNTAVSLDLTTNKELKDLETYASNAGFKPAELSTAQAAQNEGFTKASDYNTALSEGFNNNKDYQLADQLDITTSQGLTNLQEFAAKGGFGTNVNDPQVLQEAQTAQGLNLSDATELKDLQTYSDTAGFGKDLGNAQKAQEGGFEDIGNYTTAKNLNISTLTELQALQQYASDSGFSESKLADAQKAQEGGFTDVNTFTAAQKYGVNSATDWADDNAAAQKDGWKNYDQQQVATNAGFSDPSVYNVAQKYGIETQSAWTDVNAEAQKNGWKGYDQQQTAGDAGFSDPKTYETAQKYGIDTMDNWTQANTAAQDAGWRDYVQQQTALDAGFEEPSDLAINYVDTVEAFQNAQDPLNEPTPTEEEQTITEEEPTVTEEEQTIASEEPNWDFNFPLLVMGKNIGSSNASNIFNPGKSGTGATGTAGASGASGTNGLTAQQLAILATPTIFTPAAPTVDVGAPKVNLAGLVDQPAPVAQNNTSYAGYMSDLPDLGYLPYDYGGPQDAQAVTFASPNQAENTTMAATGGSVDDLLRIMNWRV